MEIYLTRLLVAYFQRTIFLDFKKLEDDLRKIPAFDKANKNQFPSFGPTEIGIPVFELSSITAPFSIVVFQNKIEFSMNAVVPGQSYDDVFDSFFTLSNKLSQIVAPEDKENMCGRIGIINDSFIIDENPINRIREKYFKKKSVENTVNLSLSFTKTIPTLESFGAVEIANVQQASINTTNQKGIYVRKDINIPKEQTSIPAVRLNAFIDESIKYMNKQEMMRLV